MIHFVMGANSSLINEFPFTQVGPFERFMKWQRKNNPHMVATNYLQIISGSERASVLKYVQVIVL